MSSEAPSRTECSTRFQKSTSPDNKGSITFKNESNQPAQILTNGRLVGTVPLGGQQTFSATIGQTFVVNGLNVRLAQKTQLVTIPVIQRRPEERNLYPLASNRDVSGLRSINGQTATAITFVNETRNDVNVNWIDYQGRRQRYKTLKGFESYRQTTYVTHPWEVVTDGRAVIYLPTENAEYIVFIGCTNNPTLIPLSASESVDLRSKTPNGPATSVNFINNSNSAASISWINFQGGRTLYNTLNPGGTYHQTGFTTNYWEVAVGSVKTSYALIDAESDVIIN